MTSLWSKFKLPYWLLMCVAYVCNVFTWISGKQFKLKPFNVRVLTMHRWFNIAAAEKDLNYSPIIPFDEGWSDMIEGMRANWLPQSLTRRNIYGLAQQSQSRIDSQVHGSEKRH